jgi:hypothetical protein
MNRFQAYCSLLLTLSCSACNQETAGPGAFASEDENSPTLLEIAFRPFSGLFTRDNAGLSCGVPAGRQQIYDPKTGVFHIHFKSQNYTRSAFEVKKVADRFTKPIVFRLTGDTRGYGCLGHDLTFSVDGKEYPLADSMYADRQIDKTLFRVEHKEQLVTIEFTQKGQALLKPGAQVWLSVDTGW